MAPCRVNQNTIFLKSVLYTPFYWNRYKVYITGLVTMQVIHDKQGMTGSTCLHVTKYSVTKENTFLIAVMINHSDNPQSTVHSHLKKGKC